MLFGGTPVKSNNEFCIDFDSSKRSNYEAIDLQIFISKDSIVYKLNDNEFNNYLLKLNKKLQKYHLIPYQLHSLWEFGDNKSDEEKNWDLILPYYIKAIEGAHILGVKYVVIHHRFPFGYFETEQTKNYGKELNIKFLKKLLPYATKNDVTLCLENLPFDIEYSKINGTLSIIKSINDDHVKMCLDTGHLNCIEKDKDIYKWIKKIGSNLKCLHVHDNLGDGDYHLLPWQGSINWDDFTKGLKEINFDGCISLETQSKKENLSERCTENKLIIEKFKNLFDELLDSKSK